MSLLEKLQGISNSKKIMTIIFSIAAIALIAFAVSAMFVSKPVVVKTTPTPTSSASASEVTIVNPDLVIKGRKIYYDFCLIKPSETSTQRKARISKYIYEDSQIPDAAIPNEIKSRDCVFYEGGGLFLESSDTATVLQIHAKQSIIYTNGVKESKEVYAKLVLINDNGTYKIQDISY